MALFRFPAPRSSGNRVEMLSRGSGSLWTTKNLIIRARTREMGTQISVKSLRRRLWRRRSRGQSTFWPPNVLAKAGQHRLPGGQEAKGPGVFGPGSVEGSRFESHTTLHVTMFILYCESDGGKSLVESPP